ncbi:glycoside hydrolase family 16 protein [candidate division KSB1 bacterium]|nr:glycoside hydrolase family 16 protein [candidate division KSB1 bacterium]
MRTRIFILSLVGLASLSSSGCRDSAKNPLQNNDDPHTIPNPEGWTLVWNDEFSGDSIDPAKWEHEVNAQGGGNNELQYYTDRSVNSFIEEGCLVIQALRENYKGPEGTREYTSARLRTKNKGDWKYGRFDIRARLPFGQGIWPAIWMLPTEGKYGGWAASGEIDIMELLGHEPNKVYGTLHYGGEWPNNIHSGKAFLLKENDFSSDFHLFTLEWSPGVFRWYVDGELYQTQTQWYSSNGSFPAPFDEFFHLVLNVAVGGNWPGNPDNSTVFPQKMIIDHVRVYKSTD